MKTTSTAICGSDLHLYDGFIPAMEKGDVLGHEFMGEVVEGGGVGNLRVGDRVVVPFPIACGAAAPVRPAGGIDPSFVISHRLPLEEAPRGYEIVKQKQEDCAQVVLPARRTPGDPPHRQFCRCAAARAHLGLRDRTGRPGGTRVRAAPAPTIRKE